MKGAGTPPVRRAFSERVMRLGGMGLVGFAALWLAACGGDGERADAAPAAPADQAQQADAPPQAAAAPAPAPGDRAGDAPARAQAPMPTAEDSAAAEREDVSPEWKMNQRKMAPYADCMAEANAAPEHVRARLQAACRNLPDAPG